MHSLVKAACVIHNLSLATAFGAPLFAKKALRPALIDEVQDEKERGKLMAAAWNKYTPRNVASHVLFTATWLVERSAISKMHVDHGTRKMVAFKDVLITGAVLTGIATIAAGKQIQRDYPDGFPVSDKPSNDPKVEQYRRFFRVVGTAHLVFLAGSLAMGPLIGAGIIRSERRSLLARLLGL